MEGLGAAPASADPDSAPGQESGMEVSNTEVAQENERSSEELGEDEEQKNPVDEIIEESDTAQEQDEIVEDLIQRVTEEAEQLGDLREQIGTIPLSEPTATEEFLQEKKKQIEERRNKIDQLKRELLEVPETEFENEEVEEQQAEIEALEETDSPQKREFIMKSFIERMKNRFSQSFKDIFSKAENGDRAKKLMLDWTEKKLRKVGGEFIADPTKIDQLAIKVTISCAEFDTDDGRKSYVNGLNVEAGDHIAKEIKEEEERLLTHEDKNELDEAREDENITVQEEKKGGK